ncbi:MAG: sugar phosphate isomerase/epimerase [Clostridiaceae bacterium]|nr:sugar phosphate isomerase/epimerase [Clostridiaceae bacterium]
MKKGINIWSFPPYTLDECIEAAARHNFDGIELALDAPGAHISADTTPEELKRIRRRMQDAGLATYSLASLLPWSVRLSDADPTVRAQAVENLKSQLEAAAILGCDSILVVPGVVVALDAPTVQVAPYGDVYKWSHDSIAQAVPLAEELGIRIGIENVWNHFLISPLEMRDYVDSFGSKAVAAYFDVGNILRYGFPVDWIRTLGGERLCKIHIKDYRYASGAADLSGFVDLLTGDVDFPAVMAALNEVGYDDWLTAELAPYAHYPEAGLAGISRAMDAILGRNDT